MPLGARSGTLPLGQEEDVKQEKQLARARQDSNLRRAAPERYLTGKRVKRREAISALSAGFRPGTLRAPLALSRVGVRKFVLKSRARKAPRAPSGGRGEE